MLLLLNLILKYRKLKFMKKIVFVRIILFNTSINFFYISRLGKREILANSIDVLSRRTPKNINKLNFRTYCFQIYINSLFPFVYVIN